MEGLDEYREAVKPPGNWWRCHVERQRATTEHGIALIELVRASFERREVLRWRWQEQALERQVTVRALDELIEGIGPSTDSPPLTMDGWARQAEAFATHSALEAAIDGCLQFLRCHVVPTLDEGIPTLAGDNFYGIYAEVERKCEVVYALRDRFHVRVEAFLEELID